MSENISVPLDLITTPLFDKKHNISYNDSDFDGTNKWQIVISSICPNNISDCINNSNGALNSSVSNNGAVDISLTLEETDDYNSGVKITNDVTLTLSDDVDVKGVFLRKKSNGFVLMAMVNPKPMRFCDKVIFKKDNVLFLKTRTG